MARNIKQGDTVMVIAGDDAEKTGKVLRVVTKSNRVVVEGINRVWKHVKPSRQYPQGGRIQKEAPIHLSNVLPVDPANGKASRVRFEVREGRKHRVTRDSGTDLGALGKKQ
jgi:large subunit ribosomal protein L24